MNVGQGRAWQHLRLGRRCRPPSGEPPDEGDRARCFEGLTHPIVGERTYDPGGDGRSLGEERVVPVDSEQSGHRAEQHRGIAGGSGQLNRSPQIGDRLPCPAQRVQCTRARLEAGHLVLQLLSVIELDAESVTAKRVGGRSVTGTPVQPIKASCCSTECSVGLCQIVSGDGAT